MSHPFQPTSASEAAAPIHQDVLGPAVFDRAVRVAQQAAEQAMITTRDMPVGRISTKKHPADLVTETDTAVERSVREVITAEFDDHAVVGEEYGGEPADGPTWYCDPVDGTTNLAAGLPWTSFSLCLAVGRRPLVGVVADPWRNDVWLAAEGQGVLINGRRPETDPGQLATPVASTAGAAEHPDTETTGIAGTVVGTEWASYRPWPGMQQFLSGLAERHCTGRIMGSSTLTLAQPAVGRTVGAVIHGFQPEDHLAAALLGQEAGLAVWDEAARQQPFPDDGGLMVARPDIADELYRLWSRARAEYEDA